MRSIFRAAMYAAALTLPLTLSGCGPKTEAKKPADKHEHGEHSHEGHDHASLGPHEGHLLELGQEEYHAEWTHDDASGKVVVYILDSAAKKDVPIAAENLTIKIKVGDKEQAHVLEAVNRSTGDTPTSAQFEIVNKPLVEALETVGSGTEASLEVTIGDRPFVAKFDSHAGHDHAGHKH